MKILYTLLLAWTAWASPAWADGPVCRNGRCGIPAFGSLRTPRDAGSIGTPPNSGGAPAVGDGGEVSLSAEEDEDGEAPPPRAAASTPCRSCPLAARSSGGEAPPAPGVAAYSAKGAKGGGCAGGGCSIGGRIGGFFRSLFSGFRRFCRSC